MPDVRVTVDGREVFARDCTDFQCEQTASGEFTASGRYPAVATGDDEWTHGAVFKNPGEFIPDTTVYGVITDAETPPAE